MSKPSTKMSMLLPSMWSWLILFLLLGCRQSELTRPNIVLIMVDDLGKEWVGCYGADSIATPHIDALAGSGVRFENVYCMPQCTPTRLTLLTGQYPFRHGWVNHWDVPRWGGGAHFDETRNPCFPRHLRDAGYRTAIAGKWQIDDFRVEPDALERAGFDEWCMWTGYETGIPASAERYQDPYLYTQTGSRSYPDSFGPDVMRDFLIDFMCNDDARPFFAYYPMVLTHTPLVNTPDETADDPLGRHKAMVRYTDKITGQIVDALSQEGLLDNTLIIWTTDNGTTRGVTGTRKGHEIAGGKAKTEEAGVNVPFIISWPAKLEAGRTSDVLIDFTDLMPTLLEIGGADLAAASLGQQLDGHSFAPFLQVMEPFSPRTWIMSMGGGNHARLTNEGVENQFVFRDRVLRDQRFKLYIDTRREASAFFDLMHDPMEQINLIDRMPVSAHSAFERLMAATKDFPKRDSDPRYQANPAQVWDVQISADAEVWKQ